MKQLSLRGVYPASLTPFREDYSLDEGELCRHIRDLSSVRGVSGIIANGHAGEVTSLSSREYSRILELAKQTVGDTFPIISGVLSDTPGGAIEIAKRAKSAGADAILLFPPNVFTLEAAKDGEIPYRFISSVADAVEIPIVVFQFSIASGVGYSTDTLVRLVENIPSIVGIKEGSDQLQRYEENLRALRACSHQVAILCTNNTKLLPSLAVGGDGIISGSGSVIANLHAALWEAIEQNDLHRARAVNDQIFPLTQVFYRAPIINMHNRMKVALQLLGRQKYAVARPPLLPIQAEEREAIRAALAESGLLA